MEPSPGPWISALRHSHDRLRASVEPLGPDQLTQRSYPSEWTIAQVLSHLGSQAEIFGLILEAGLAGREPPDREEFSPIWDAWNAKDPQAQATDALRADQATLERLESMDAGEQGSSSWRRARRSRSRPRVAMPRPSWGLPSCGCPPRR
jgi:Mycothiol maleylpyruvate isomerase N-terminal domain